MLILAIDTATSTISIALNHSQQVISETTWLAVGHHTQELPPMVDAMLRRAGHSTQALSAIAVALGPGSYTGLRIGMSFAKGIALACNPSIPLIGVPTLDIIAYAQPHLCECLIAVIQAGRGRVNAASYKFEGRWVAAEPPFIATWDELASRIKGAAQIAGEVDEAGRAALAALGDRVMIASSAQGLRRAGYLTEIACERLASGEVDDPATLAPIYYH